MPLEEIDLDDTQGRFAHLLKPIRDLAENFSIDLAHELEEYLDQLENTQFSFEGGNSLDFAEAALLIQVRLLSLQWFGATLVLNFKKLSSGGDRYWGNALECVRLVRAGKHMRVQQEGGVLVQPGVPSARCGKRRAERSHLLPFFFF